MKNYNHLIPHLFLKIVLFLILCTCLQAYTHNKCRCLESRTSDPLEQALWAAWCGVGTTLRSSAESALNHRVISTDPWAGGKVTWQYASELGIEKPYLIHERMRSPNKLMACRNWERQAGCFGENRAGLSYTLTECKTSQPHEWEASKVIKARQQGHAYDRNTQ